jgi:hypothetical protein
MATVVVAGERWEVEFFADGHVEVEIFRSTDEAVREGHELLEKLFLREGESTARGAT